MTGVSIVTVASVLNFESNLLSRKFSSRTRFVKGHLLSRIDAFHLNKAVNPFSQLSASVRDISRLRLPVGFSVFSKRCGLGVWVDGIGLGSRCGMSMWAFVTFSKGGIWCSDADFS